MLTVIGRMMGVTIGLIFMLIGIIWVGARVLRNMLIVHDWKEAKKRAKRKGKKDIDDEV